MRSIEELNKAAKESRDAFGIRGEYAPECTIKVYMSEQGIKLGAQTIVKTIIEELESKQKYAVAVTLIPFEENEQLMPMIQIHDSHNRKVTYVNLDKEKIRKIIIEHIMFGKIVTQYQKNKEVI